MKRSRSRLLLPLLSMQSRGSRGCCCCQVGLTARVRWWSGRAPGKPTPTSTSGSPRRRRSCESPVPRSGFSCSLIALRSACRPSRAASSSPRCVAFSASSRDRSCTRKAGPRVGERLVSAGSTSRWQARVMTNEGSPRPQASCTRKGVKQAGARFGQFGIQIVAHEVAGKGSPRRRSSSANQPLESPTWPKWASFFGTAAPPPRPPAAAAPSCAGWAARPARAARRRRCRGAARATSRTARTCSTSPSGACRPRASALRRRRRRACWRCHPAAARRRGAPARRAMTADRRRCPRYAATPGRPSP